MISLYTDPASSEVSEEYPTLHAALEDNRAPRCPDAMLVENGTTLAQEWCDRWQLTIHGSARLVREWKEAEHVRTGS